jgi:bacterioferritin (cytochrome b1)
MISSLNEDLMREYAHWHFYIRAAAVVTGLHRQELSELFFEEAEGEMKHILEFQKLILGLGGIPETKAAEFNINYSDPSSLLFHAYAMENQVVSNYAKRMDDCDLLEKNDNVNAKRIKIFLENQMQDSRDAADNYQEMLKGNS